MKLKTSHAVCRGLFVLGFSISLASCSWFGKKEVEAKIPCPQVAVISDADLYTRFQPNAEWSRKSLLYEAQIARVKSACDFLGPKPKKEKADKDKKDGKTDDKPKTLLAALTLSFEVYVHPKHKGKPVKLPYFVAITDRQTNILNKQTFEAVAPPPEKEEKKSKKPKSQAVFFTDKPVTLKIPLKKGQTGADYMIFAGFQVTPEQLDLNRKRRRPPEEYGIKEPSEETEKPKAN